MVWKTRAARAALSGGGVDGRSAGADVVESSGWCGVEGVDCAGGAVRTVRVMRCGQSGRRGADSEGGADSVVRNLKASRGRGQCWQMARTARMVQDGADGGRGTDGADGADGAGGGGADSSTLQAADTLPDRNGRKISPMPLKRCPKTEDP